MKISIQYRDMLNRERVSKFNWNGNDYLNIRVYPSIVLEMRNEADRENFKTGISLQKVINLDRFSLYRFVNQCKELIEGFVTEEKLYVYKDNHLMCNRDLANKISVTIPLSFNRMVWISPCVVLDQDTRQELEGVVLCYNTSDNFVFVAYEEFKFMIQYLESLDIDSLGLQLVAFAELTNDKAFSKIDELPEQMPKTDESKADSVSGFVPKEVSVIPDI